MPTPEQREERLKELQADYGISEDHLDEFRELIGTKTLREQNAQLAAEAKKVPDLEKRLAKFENADKVREAFEKQGLDWEALDDLPLLVKESVESFGEFEDEEKVAQFIERNKLPTVESSEATGGEESGAAAVAEHAQRSSRDGGHSKTTISAKDIAEWSPDKIASFQADHPELYQKALEGESVVAPG